MKALRSVLFLLAVLGLTVAPATAQSKAQASFDKLKTLVGYWEGTTSKDKVAKATYRLVSNGSALEETLNSGEDETMVTMYHLDGDRLMVTHYCSVGNQPRMVAAPNPKNSNVIAFKFLDATNLASPDAGHMRNLVVTFVDKDHFTQQWTWHEKGKEDLMETFKLTRKR